MSGEGGFDLRDYKTVPERIEELKEQYPEAVLRAQIVELPAAFADKFLAVQAEVWLTPDATRPATGIAWEPVPGKTPFTRDSELQNAETSAWGRAIVAALAADTSKGIASSEEVLARRAEPVAENWADWILKTLVADHDIAQADARDYASDAMSQLGLEHPLDQVAARKVLAAALEMRPM